MKMWMFTVVLVVSASTVSFVHADSGVLYAGVGVGRSSADLPARMGYAEITNESTSSTAVSLTIGDRINPYLAFELNYSDLGSYSYDANPYSLGINTNEVTEDSTSIGLAILIRHEVRATFAPFIKLGGFRSSTEYKITTNSTNKTSASSEDFGYLFGIGADLKPMEHVFARVDWTFYRDVGGANPTQGKIEKTNISLLMLSGFFEF